MPKINPIARALRHPGLHQRRVKPKKGRGAYSRKDRRNDEGLSQRQPPHPVGCGSP